jgi:hypothetical protein
MVFFAAFEFFASFAARALEFSLQLGDRTHTF